MAHRALREGSCCISIPELILVYNPDYFLVLFEQPEQLGGYSLGERLLPAAADHDLKGRLEAESAAQHVAEAVQRRGAPVEVVAESLSEYFPNISPI